MTKTSNNRKINIFRVYPPGSALPNRPPRFSPSVVRDVFGWRQPSILWSAQFAEPSVETGFVISAAESDKFPLLLVSSKSFCVASAASCTSLSSSETDKGAMMRTKPGKTLSAGRHVGPSRVHHHAAGRKSAFSKGTFALLHPEMFCFRLLFLSLLLQLLAHFLVGKPVQFLASLFTINHLVAKKHTLVDSVTA